MYLNGLAVCISVGSVPVSRLTLFGCSFQLRRSSFNKLPPQLLSHLLLNCHFEIEISIQEIASMLIAFDRHHDWMSKEVKIRPKSGSMLLYSRKKVSWLLWPRKKRFLPLLIFRFVTAETATAGRRGRTGRQPGRTTWSWKSREWRWRPSKLFHILASPPPCFSYTLAIEGRRGEAAFQSASCSTQLCSSLSRDAPGAKMSKDPRLVWNIKTPASKLLFIRTDHKHWPRFSHCSASTAAMSTPPSFQPSTVDAIGSFRLSLEKSLDFIKFWCRIRILSLCTTWTCPTRTTTRCWSPTLCLCGGRRRSGQKRSSSLSWNQCVSVIV